MKISKNNNDFLRNWLPLVLSISFTLLVVYVAIQQDLRQSANDPQIQLASDVADSLSLGTPIVSALPTSRIDLSKSDSSFVIVYDSNGKPVQGTAILEKKLPTPPSGVFDYLKTNSEDRFTWQPTSDIREAVVMRSYVLNGKKGFVLAGRSLKEVEQRELNLGQIMLFGWFFILILTGLLVHLTRKRVDLH